MPKDILSDWRLARHNFVSVKLHDEKRYRSFVEALLKRYGDIDIVDKMLEIYHQHQSEVLQEDVNDIFDRIWEWPELFKGNTIGMAAGLKFAKNQSLASMVTFFKEWFTEKPPPPPSMFDNYPRVDPETLSGWRARWAPFAEKEKEQEEQDRKRQEYFANKDGPEKKEKAPRNEGSTEQPPSPQPERKYKRPCKMPRKRGPEEKHQSSDRELPNNSSNLSRPSKSDEPKQNKEPTKSMPKHSHQGPPAPSQNPSSGCEESRKRSSCDDAQEIDKQPRQSTPEKSDGVASNSVQARNNGCELKRKRSSCDDAQERDKQPRQSAPEKSNGVASDSVQARDNGCELKHKRSSCDDAQERDEQPPRSTPENFHRVAPKTSQAPDHGCELKRKRSNSEGISESSQNAKENEMPAPKRARESSHPLSGENQDALMLELFGDIYEDIATPSPPSPDTLQSDTGQEHPQQNTAPSTLETPPSSPPAHMPSTTKPRSPQPADPSSSDPHPTGSASPTLLASQ